MLRDDFDYLGFHGTDLNNKDSILTKGFQESKGDEHWLGNGVYFFIGGMGFNPKENAQEWAITNAWDNTVKSLKYKDYLIMSTKIHGKQENLLDLDTQDGSELFYRVKKRIEKDIYASGKGALRHKNYDGKVINALIKTVKGILFVKKKLFFKTKNDRIFKKHSNIPNCIVLTVREPEKTLSTSHIQIISKGKIL